ncbi:alpha/beta hydrolase [Halobacteriales archaeon QS_3_64_16]|nr:MAG: alpha/beta hydrolase [Halobacteriales archaeon QS_3_64_16]
MADLHPEATELLDELDRGNLPPSAALSPAGAREAIREVLIGRGPEIEVGRVREFPIESPGDLGDDLVLRCYEPDEDGRESWADDSIPILLYYHGGGWVRGDLDTHDELCRYLTRELGCLTVAVEYRRAPEHPFPAAAEDAYAALQWVGKNAPVFGADPKNIAVAGDSAGGNLAAVTALAARDRGGPNLCRQVLLYPVTDHALDSESYEERAENPMLSRATMEWYWDHYLSRAFDGAHPYASPLRARDLSDLPPATVITAGHDPLRDEGEAYADRLRDAGVETTYTDYEGMLHAFVSFPALERASEAREQIVGVLREAFEDGE